MQSIFRELVLVGAIALIGINTACSSEKAAPEASSRNMDASDLPRSLLVYQRDSGIFMKEFPSAKTTHLANSGSYPRFSPDGKQVAFLQEGGIVRMATSGGKIHQMCEVNDGRAVAWHPNGDLIFFSDGKEVKSVSIKTGEISTELTGEKFRELDISADGSTLVATVRSRLGPKIRAYDLNTDKDWEVVKGCSASLSPDGKLVTNNEHGHTVLTLRDVKSGDEQQRITAPPGEKFDNQFWSNKDNYIVSITEGDRQNVLIHEVNNDRYFTATASGDCDRPDLFITE